MFAFHFNCQEINLARTISEVICSVSKKETFKMLFSLSREQNAVVQKVRESMSHVTARNNRSRNISTKKENSASLRL